MSKIYQIPQLQSHSQNERVKAAEWNLALVNDLYNSVAYHKTTKAQPLINAAASFNLL